MNLDKDISSWAKVQPNSVSSMSGAAQTNVLTMALHDIAQLGAEVERLREAAQFALAKIEKGAPGWGVAKDVLRLALKN